jgi:hypothetical protein
MLEREKEKRWEELFNDSEGLFSPFDAPATETLYPLAISSFKW